MSHFVQIGNTAIAVERIAAVEYVGNGPTPYVELHLAGNPRRYQFTGPGLEAFKAWWGSQVDVYVVRLPEPPAEEQP